MNKRIRKRDGRIVDFDEDKITNAIFAAAQAVGGKDRELSKKLALQVTNLLREKFNDHEIPTVEQIQDMIEYVLVEEGHYRTAKAYILYRQQHKRAREFKNVMLDVNDTISSYLQRGHWDVNENSNEQYSFSGLLLYTAGKVIKNYAMHYIYPGEISEAHEKGNIHVHDLSHAVVGYCAGWSLMNLLKKGFGGVRNKVDAKPAKHMDVVVHQMVNYIGCLQMEWAGAQAFSSVDTLLAPFVKTDNLTYKQVKQNMQKLVFSLNIPSRWGSQYPFSNLTFDWVAPDDLKNKKAIVGGKKQDFTYADCQKEMDMVNKAFLEVLLEGDANGRIFTFPIPTYNLTKSFMWDTENADLLFKLTAKYGSPYFQNYIGSNLDPRSIRAMCCRLNLDMNQLIKRPGGTFSMGDSTGSLGVVTINMNRIGYEAKTKEEFKAKLKHYMTLAKNSLEIKRRIVQKNMDQGLMPYTKVYLGTLRNHFSTIGLCGMNEACLNFLGKSLKSPEGKEFTIEILNFMRDVIREFQVETENIYNLEATPAESTAYRFGRLDKMLYPDIITAGEEVPYLTNSTQLPVGETDDLIEALLHQNDIQPLYTGGTMFHTYLGQKVSSPGACKRIVQKIANNTRLPYFSITPTFSICPDHGYILGEYFTCPAEVSAEPTSDASITSKGECEKKCEVYSRIVGYYRPVDQWNSGKKEEFKQRVMFSENIALTKEFSVKLPEKTEMTLTNKESDTDIMTNLITRYRVFSLPNCDKCKSIKEYLAKATIEGTDTSLKDKLGVKEFRKYYRLIKDKIQRTEDGSLPIPTVLFFDKNENIVATAHNVDQAKAVLSN
ncbi:ribonucleoside triphosphate reductase [Candidatus Woesearchaeota archaeon]|nr:ribonucleoside triphosphate reductase [Candidatus Woesearchaeota archaeon]